MTNYRVSMDIGGTFTDFVVYDEERDRAFTSKVLSTPDDPARGVIAGLTDLVENPGEIAFLVHGTTVGLNAFLERRGTHHNCTTTAWRFMAFGGGSRDSVTSKNRLDSAYGALWR